jgi:hypothetical protein
MNYMESYIKYYMLFCKQLPGIENLTCSDFYRLITINLPLMFIWSLVDLAITKDSFLINEGVQINKTCITEFFDDDEICRFIYEYQSDLKTLELSEKEMAILTAFLLTYVEPCNIFI